MEKQSTGRVMMKLVVSVLALFLLMACGVLMGACKGEHEHNYKKSTSENMAATCGSTGYDIYECDGCGDRYAVPTYATGNHNFVNGYCTVCGLPNSYDDAQLQQLLSDINSKVEAVRTSINDLHQHDYSKETVTVNATCYASGFIAMKCECGSSAITKALDKLDHEWDAETITVPASCTTVGEVYRKCKNCETVVLYETIPVAGHKFGTEMETIVAATCTEPGYRGYKCSVCGEMGYSEQIPATDHNMVWSTKANTDGYAANCLHGDYTWYHCANENCPENWGVPTEVSAKGGHDFGFGEKYETGEFKNEEIKKATCTEARVIVRKCRACGASEGVQVTDDKNGALGHTWERKDKDGKLIVDLSKVTADDEHIVGTYEPALCNKTGRFTYKCGECDEVINYVIAVDKYAHKAVEENGAAKKIDTISQLTGNLASMNGNKDEEGKDKNYHWNTVTYTHYLCEYCREWLVKTEDIPEGGEDYLKNLTTFPKPSTTTTPSTTPTPTPSEGSGSEGGEEEAPKGEYSVIKRVFFEYSKIDLDEDMKVWVDKGILGFSWHSWQDYDNTKKAEEGKGAVVNDNKETVQIGDANCETDGVHWYHCIDPNCTIVETSVITPAVGHNYDIPDTLAQWEELLSTNVNKGKEPPTPNGHTQSEDYYSKPGTGTGEEAHKTFSEVMNARGDIFYGADCTEYAVVFVGCTNCFLKGELVTGEQAKGDGVTHCMGDKEERRVAITVRVTVDKETKSETKELTVIDLTEDIVTEKKPTPASGEGSSETAGKILSDEKIAERILDLDAWVEEYNKKDGLTDEQKINIDDIRHPIYDANVGADTVAQIYDAFEGRLEPGQLSNTEEGSDKNPKLDEFRKEEKKEGNTTTNAYYVFDPLGHVWQLGKDEFKPSETVKEQEWNVRKPTPKEHLKEGEEAPTFNCTEPGYTGRWCSRACCEGKEETLAEGENPTEQVHQYDRHQKISLERDLENLKLEEGDEDPRDYAYDLHRQDKDGKEYWLVVKETGKTTANDTSSDFKPEVIKGELTYEEINELFELLVEKEHKMDYRVLTENVKCGDEATVNWFCVNCTVKFPDKIQEVKHLGNFGHYYTIGACGTAFGEDHNIITYDYCLDCGKRVGLEVVEETDTVTGKVSKVETRNVVWTEGDPNTLTGEPVDILPCELSTIKTNYRHFPFDRDFIDGLLKETKTETVTSGSSTTTKTVPNPNYKLYSAIWSAIDKWYETNDDELLRASCLTGILMTKTTTDKANGWTARCHDCYTEFLSHKCSNTSSTSSEAKDRYYVVNNGVVVEFDNLPDLVTYFVKDDIRRGFIENNKVSKNPIPDAEIDNLVETQYKAAGTVDKIKNGWAKTAGLKNVMQDGSWTTSTTQDNKIQVILASHVRADIYTAKVTVCETCKSYNWTKENGKIFTKIELTAEKAPAAGAGA